MANRGESLSFTVRLFVGLILAPFPAPQGHPPGTSKRTAITTPNLLLFRSIHAVENIHVQRYLESGP